MNLNISLDEFNRINFMNSLKKENKRNQTLRKTGFKGIHVHYDKNRENISFRPTLKINNQEVMGYQNFEFDYFGLFIALRYYDKKLLDYLKRHPEHNVYINDKTFKPKYPFQINDIKISYQIEQAIIHKDIFSLKLIYKTLTDIEEIQFDEIRSEIENGKK